MARLTHGNAIVVVLADKDNGELPDRCQVQRFMECALIGGAVPEEADANPIRSPITSGKASSYRNVMACANDAIGTQNPLVAVSNVHRTAFPLAVAGGFPK